jgi:hypothetical protein
MNQQQTRRIFIVFALLILAITACAPSPEPEPTPTVEPSSTLQRDPNVPELPFADNPDPSLCGIPTPWGTDEPAWLTGIFQGELIQPTVLLYDSHLRRSIQGSAPHGTEVRILLHQSNPALDYYLVRTVNHEPPQEGWIPAPFLSFHPVNQ